MKTLLSRIFRAAGSVAVAAGLVSTSAGCAGGEKYLRADPASVEIAADRSDAIPVTVDASASWVADISGVAEWLSYTYDDALSVLWVHLEDTNESLEERRAEINIVSGDGLSLTIPLLQHAMDAYLEVTPPVIAPFGARDTETGTLTVATGLSWDFSVLHENWVKVTREGNTLSVGVEATRSLNGRRDTIVVRPVNEAFLSLADSIAVVQEGLELVVTSPLMNPATYVTELPAGGGPATLSVYAKAAWKITTDAPAGKVTLDLREGGADIENGTPVVVTVAGNTSEEEYAFTLAFECGDEIYEYQFVQATAAEVGPEPEPDPES